MSTMTTVQILDSIEEGNAAYTVNANNHTFYFVHVQKDKAHSALEIENPRYTVKLDRNKGAKLGFRSNVEAEEKTLFVKEVISGLAFSWNKQHKDQKIRAGDRIVRINNVAGDAHKLFEESKTKQMLEIEIHRGTALAISEGITVTLKQSFGAFRSAGQGIVVKVDDDGDALMKIGKYKQWVAKKDYDKFLFEDADRFYLKRYVDFEELNSLLKKNLQNGEGGPIKMLEDLPEQEKIQFRQQGFAGKSAAETGREVLQKYTDKLMEQAPQFDQVPELANFFGDKSIPDLGTKKEFMLKQRLDVLITKFKQEQKEQKA